MPPALPTHSVVLYFVLAFGMAMAFSVSLGFTAEYFDPTIRTPDEAFLLLHVPVLAWLPANVAPAPDFSPNERRKVVIS